MLERHWLKAHPEQQRASFGFVKNGQKPKTRVAAFNKVVKLLDARPAPQVRSAGQEAAARLKETRMETDSE